MASTLALAAREDAAAVYLGASFVTLLRVSLIENVFRVLGARRVSDHVPRI